MLALVWKGKSRRKTTNGREQSEDIGSPAWTAWAP